MPPHRSAWAAASLVLFLYLFFPWLPPDALARAPVRDAADVEIRRATGEVPHIVADDWHGIGMGLGYSQAHDALCTLADAFVTFRGRRSYFFGAESAPAYRATFTEGARNIDLDVFFSAFLDQEAVAAFTAAQPRDLMDAVDGYVEGYNRYLASAKGRRSASHACGGKEWVGPISRDDLVRRMLAAGLAAGYERFVSQIANAAPAHERSRTSAAALPAKPYRSASVGDAAGLGSNMIAFGRDGAGEGAVLFGNPHWFWGGPDRFYQARLTMPGRLNVAGVSFLGVPVVMLGFNEHVAWSHTVSQARRFGLFALRLSAENPTMYWVDGQLEPMQAKRVRIAVRGRHGHADFVERTLYRTRFGPVVDLGAHAEQLGWTATTALAIRDINAENHRVFRNYLAWNQARSLDEFVEVQRRELAMPWVNTAAIARDDPRVWFGDVGAVPNVPDALRAKCRSALGEVFAQMDAAVPVLDGSRSECDWPADARSPQAGAMPAQALPGMLRRDYVANMNDSYWLTNPREPLEGFAAVLGGERQPLSLRGRHGHSIAQAVIGKAGHDPRRLVDLLKGEALSSREYAADQFKPALLSGACSKRSILVRVDLATEKQYEPARSVDLSEACRVLMSWNNSAAAHDGGALLWDAFWARVSRLPEQELFAVPFSPADALHTPASPRETDARLPEALGAAVLAMQDAGRALGSSADDWLFVRTEGKRLPLFGGCEGGYFTIACPANGAADGRMDERAHANTYLQIVRFGPAGVEASTMLAHGQDESSVRGGPGGRLVEDYARRKWRPVRLTDGGSADRGGATVRLKRGAPERD